MPIVTSAEWNRFISKSAEAHLLQTSAWGELKRWFGWEAVPMIAGDSGALVLFRRLPLGFRIAYIPKCPVGIDWRSLLTEIDHLCLQRRAVFLKVEPDSLVQVGHEFQGLGEGFHCSSAVQPRRTLLVSVEGGETQMLERMKQKTRYNIRLAERKGVVVSPTDDVDGFHRLMLQTGNRDGFGVHSLGYYRKAYELFNQLGECVLLRAAYQQRSLAAVMIFRHGSRAWYFYGASIDDERHRMPSYLLQWEAMLWARQNGCSSYDLWGVPDEDEEQLEAAFTNRIDGLWSVYRFKRGFGGRLVRSVGAWDRVYQPGLYTIYRKLMRFRRGDMG